MAVKSQAQCVTLLAELAELREDMRAVLAGEFMTNVNAVSAAIDAGDDVAEDTVSDNALKQVVADANTLFASINNLVRTVAPHLGRLAGAANLTDYDLCIAKWNEYLHANAQNVEVSGLSVSATMTANGSNVGTGKVIAGLTDAESLVMDIGHIETKTIRCTMDATQGATAGREIFTIFGTTNASLNLWDALGSGSGQGYAGIWGKGSKEWPSNVKQSNVTIRSCGAARGAGNIIKNGDFEVAIGSATGTTKLQDWTISSGDATMVQASTAGTDLVAGTYSLKNTTNFLMYQNIALSDVKAGNPYALSIKGRTINGGAGTVTGTLTVKIKSRDDVTTYATLTQAIGSFSVNTNELTALVYFVLPKQHKDLKVVVELASIGGTAATPTLAIDDVMFTEAEIVDGGRAIAIHDGSNINSSGMVTGRWKYNDEYTTVTGGSYTGTNQRQFNELFGRYVKHDAAAATWTDF
jgi:hypothetical protein